ncbi:MAG: LysM peptidoglycan-binding domain-containing protein [Anaerolineaceae bacterium]|nr:LysM peptidoglycan-binding domain-containing protein [Anaerolineaceae bacterium]
MIAIKNWFFALFLAVLLSFISRSVVTAQTDTPYPDVTPQDLIHAFNALRTAKGLPALIVDPILMRTAQETADYMALNHMTSHIGDVRDRIIAAGYGVGDIPWATENFLIGPAPLDQIMLAWSDDLHMIPVNNPYYRHIGAGMSEYDGAVYYVVQAAYTSNNIYKPGATQAPQATSDILSQIIFPVRTVTPQADGRVIHIVKQGQTLWSIAIAYNTKIAALTTANHLSFDNPVIYVGQKLAIPITKLPQGNTPAAALIVPTQPIHTLTTVVESSVVIITPLATEETAGSTQQSPEDRAAVYSLILLCTAGVVYIFMSGMIKVKPNRD